MRLLALAALCAALQAAAQSDHDRREWPRFVSVPFARAWLKPGEPVIVLRTGNEVRAYPLQILMYHEIVNDTVGGVPVAVTFCPLCNASIVFERRLGERVLDFGTTGRLRFSDMVMYDRQTESWWQQFTGTGIVGRYAGSGLKKLPSEIVAFEDFAAARPQGAVLSRETGYTRPYGRNPYAGYELAGTLYVVFAKPGMASPLDAERMHAGRPIPAATAFERTLDGQVLEFRSRDGHHYDVGTGSAWLAFNPQSEIVRALP